MPHIPSCLNKKRLRSGEQVASKLDPTTTRTILASEAPNKKKLKCNSSVKSIVAFLNKTKPSNAQGQETNERDLSVINTSHCERSTRDRSSEAHSIRSYDDSKETARAIGAKKGLISKEEKTSSLKTSIPEDGVNISFTIENGKSKRAMNDDNLEVAIDTNEASIASNNKCELSSGEQVNETGSLEKTPDNTVNMNQKRYSESRVNWNSTMEKKTEDFDRNNADTNGQHMISQVADATKEVHRKEEECFNHDLLNLLANIILTAKSNSIPWITHEFLKLAKIKSISKKAIKQKISEIAEKCKKGEDGKSIWHLRKCYTNLGNKKHWSMYEQYRASVKRAKPVEKRQHDYSSDRRYMKYICEMNNLVENMRKTIMTNCVEANDFRHEATLKLSGKTDLNDDDSDLPEILTKLLHHRVEPREVLVEHIHKSLPSQFITKNKLEDMIVRLGQRKYYGYKKRGAQLQDDDLWVWEVDGLNCFSKEEKSRIITKRKMLSRMSTHLRCLARVVDLIKTNLDGKNEKRILIEEEKIIKCIRDQENKEQQEKIERSKPKGPSTTINTYFKKKEEPHRISSPIDIKRTAAQPERSNRQRRLEGQIDEAIIQQHTAIRDLTFAKYEMKTRQSFPTVYLSDSISDLTQCKYARKKFYCFYEDIRPPYYGTFRKISDEVNSRKPFARDKNLDYSYDSGDDWEEPEDGESLASEDEDEEKGEDILDYKDGWLAAEQNVEYKCENSKGSWMQNSLSEQQAKIIGVIYNNSDKTEEGFDSLLKYKIIGLPKLPIELPSMKDIEEELIPACEKQSYGSPAQNTLLGQPNSKMKAPKRALTPYKIFQKESYQKLKTAYPNSSKAEIMNLVKLEWKKVDIETKKTYIQRSADDKIRYELELQNAENRSANMQVAAIPKTKPNSTS